MYILIQTNVKKNFNDKNFIIILINSENKLSEKKNKNFKILTYLSKIFKYKFSNSYNVGPMGGVYRVKINSYSKRRRLPYTQETQRFRALKLEAWKPCFHHLRERDSKVFWVGRNPEAARVSVSVSLSLFCLFMTEIYSIVLCPSNLKHLLRLWSWSIRLVAVFWSFFFFFFNTRKFQGHLCFSSRWLWKPTRKFLFFFHP